MGLSEGPQGVVAYANHHHADHCCTPDYFCAEFSCKPIYLRIILGVDYIKDG